MLSWLTANAGACPSQYSSACSLRKSCSEHPSPLRAPRELGSIPGLAPLPLRSVGGCGPVHRRQKDGAGLDFSLRSSSASATSSSSAWATSPPPQRIWTLCQSLQGLFRSTMPPVRPGSRSSTLPASLATSGLLFCRALTRGCAPHRRDPVSRPMSPNLAMTKQCAACLELLQAYIQTGNERTHLQNPTGPRSAPPPPPPPPPTTPR